MIKKHLMALLILTPALLASNLVYADDTTAQLERKAESQSLTLANATAYVSDQFKVSKLSKRFNILHSEIASGLDVHLNAQFKSEPSFGDGFSGVDVWEMGFNYLPRTFSKGVLMPGLRESTEVTFIQQFKSRTESVVRVPYDPIQKLPVNADRALKLNTGDFVAFRSPLTFSIGKSLTDLMPSQRLKMSANLTLFSTGEFDIHIFKMDDNRVRLKLFALREKGIAGSIGTSLLGFNPLLSYFINLNPIEIFGSSNKSDLFSVDYIFNLNDATAREQFSQLLSQKYRMISLKLADMTSLVTDEAVKNMLYGDLESVQSIVNEDKNRPASERRIIRLMMGENRTVSLTTGVNVDFKLASLKTSTSESKSKISIFNIENEKKNYLLNTNTKEFSSKLFSLWGEQNKADIGLMIEADAKFDSVNVIGLQFHRLLKNLEFTKAKYVQLREKMQKTLPQEILSHMAWPEWSITKPYVKDVIIEQDMFFNAHTLETLKSINFETIKKELVYILNNSGRMNSLPMNLVFDVEADPRKIDFQKGNYIDAYSHELGYIPQLLVGALAANTSITSQIDSFAKLEQIDLFKEIGAMLLLRLIPSNRLIDAVSYRFTFSSNEIQLNPFNYPAETQQKNMNLYLSVLSHNSYIVDRSYNLGIYIDGKGKPFSLNEIVVLAK